ncbi:hypothetical protein ACIAGK_20850 [Klebsiella quasipneumoniae subsp. similipneumoniae]|uniref:hypothetical protein n=1 Tax=Klebsiella quasipneumoniae TaxID=1463165 RepID=UPI003D6DDF25
MNAPADFTYGIDAEKERNLNTTMDYFKNAQRRKLPVRVVTANELVFSMLVTGFDIKSHRIYLSPLTDDHKANRVIIPVDYIISAEHIAASEVDTAYKGQLTIRRGDLEDEGCKRSGRDFFQVIRFAHQQDKAVRVYLSDNRVIEGVSTGMNEQSVGLKLVMGNKIQLFYDWVDRVVPI